MQIFESIGEVRRALKLLRGGGEGRSLGLVPTMGALHDGHLSLLRAARSSCDAVAASIFVNPLQFGPSEDLARYPRTFEQDCAMLEAEGVDVLFARLDGASRPGHFRGVATVVMKLFHIVQPDRAFFGQKDAAQVAVLRAMVRDLNFDLEIVVCPTVRDGDGLALSSRNQYLSAAEREEALALSRALRRVRDAVEAGEVDAAALREAMLDELRHARGVRVDYAEVGDPDCLEAMRDLKGGALVAVAAWVGSTRLIDNVRLPAGELEAG